jgi:hypothetical protein
LIRSKAWRDASLSGCVEIFVSSAVACSAVSAFHGKPCARARFALEGAERLHELLLRVDGFDREQAVEELGHLARARAGNDLLAQQRQRVEGVAIENSRPDRGVVARPGVAATVAPVHVCARPDALDAKPRRRRSRVTATPCVDRRENAAGVLPNPCVVHHDLLLVALTPQY